MIIHAVFQVVVSSTSVKIGTSTMRHWDFTLSCTKSFQRCCSLAGFHTEVTQLRRQQKGSFSVVTGQMHSNQCLIRQQCPEGPDSPFLWNEEAAETHLATCGRDPWGRTVFGRQAARSQWQRIETCFILKTGQKRDTYLLSRTWKKQILT